MSFPIAPYIRAAISNGNPRKQALIRRWWHETREGRGRLVWEYFLEGRYIDGVLFAEAPGVSTEEPGKSAPTHFPIAGERVVLCEAKHSLTPELIGQALVYTRLAIRAGAQVEGTFVFAESADEVMVSIAQELGLHPLVRALDE